MEHSLGYIFGLLVGILVGVGIVALLFKLKVMDLTFDERQERARGQAYKYGFWTLLTCLLLYGFSDQIFGRPQDDNACRLPADHQFPVVNAADTLQRP